MVARSLGLVAALCFASLAHGQATDPSPTRVLLAADERVGEAASLSFDLRVEPIGAVALDQPRLDVTIRASQDAGTWRFLIEGESTLPDGVTIRPLTLWTDGSVTSWFDADAGVVFEAEGGAAMALMNEQGIFPAVFWFVLWDGLITQQLEDAGTDLPMTDAGPRTVDGRPCRAVRVDYTRQRADLGGVYDVWWFFDAATHDPVRIEACYFWRDQNAYGFNVLSISNLVLDPELSDADLVPELPAGVTIEPYAIPDLGGGDMAGPAIGSRAPDWTLSDPQGQEHSLSDYRGGVVVMDFWATWCGPCVAAMPGLQRLHVEFQGRPVHIIGLNLWESEDPAAFMAAHQLTYGLMLGADEVGEAYGVEGIPAIFAVGPDGRVIFRATGYSPDLEASLRAAIDRALPEPSEEEGEAPDSDGR